MSQSSQTSRSSPALGAPANVAIVFFADSEMSPASLAPPSPHRAATMRSPAPGLSPGLSPAPGYFAGMPLFPPGAPARQPTDDRSPARTAGLSDSHSPACDHSATPEIQAGGLTPQEAAELLWRLRRGQ